MTDEPSMGRVSTEDLTARLGESLVWVDLRVKLLTLLQKQADEGDPRARDQMEFLSRKWPGGGAPRQDEIKRLEQTYIVTYLPMDCPVCGRRRLAWDGKTVFCEKCTVSSSYDGFTQDRYATEVTPYDADVAESHLEIVKDEV